MNLKVNRSIISASISVILAAGVMGGPAYADDVKLKATNTNVAFADFTPKEYSTKNKPNIIVLTMDDLGYGQLPFDKTSFDPKSMEDQDSDGMKSYFCAGYKILFSVMVPYMNALAELEKNGIPLDKIMGIVDDIECGIKSQQQH